MTAEKEESFLVMDTSPRRLSKPNGAVIRKGSHAYTHRSINALARLPWATGHPAGAIFRIRSLVDRSDDALSVKVRQN